MKKEETPQDKSALDNITTELCYAKNENGTYEPVLSKGWEVKTSALDNAWEDINDRILEAKEAVIQGKKSPIYYYMEKNLMTPSILSSYVNMFSFRVKCHFKPKKFQKLNDKTIQKYASAFNISIEDLKTKLL